MTDVKFGKLDVSLAKIIEDIDVGEIALPEIQRPFVWPNKKVRDLFDSMYRGYPIGYFLFWKNGFAGEHKTIGGEKTKVPSLLIVDGQQRLTSLYAVLKRHRVLRKNFKKELIRIAFHPLSGKFEVSTPVIRKNPEWIADISEIWQSTGGSYSYISDFLTKLSRFREVSPQEQDEIAKAIDRLYDLHTYPITALELPAYLPEEEVAEVFVRINSTGKVLNQSDFILTLMSVYWEEGRKELETFSLRAKSPETAAGVSPYNQVFQPEPDQLLRTSVALAFRRARLEYVYSLLRGKDLETGKFSTELRDKQFMSLQGAQAQVLNLNNWKDYLKTVLTAGYRNRNYISSQIALVYGYALYLIGLKQVGVPKHQLRSLLARWLFMSLLTSRYTGAPESRMEQDLRMIRGEIDPDHFRAVLENEMSTVLTNDYWQVTLPNELAVSSAQSPAMYAYYAALVLLEAKVLYSNMKLSDLLDPTMDGSKKALERHHLFPRAYLARKGIVDRGAVNQVANYALIEWTQNIDVSDAPPREYATELERQFSKEEIDRMYHWHALPERWYEMNFQEFLDERRRRIAQVIKEGFEKLSEL